MIYNLSEQNSLVSVWMSEVRDVTIQEDRMRFRRNMERIGEVAAYEISKYLPYTSKEITTPLGTQEVYELENGQPVLATILRAGIPLFQGMLNYFDKADNAFIAAYRKHHKDGSFEIEQHYVTSPELDGKILIVADPMLATGASLSVTLSTLLEFGTPKHIHIVSVIACNEGIENILKQYPDTDIWAAAIDDELTAKGYIVPGLGDAGDLAFGPKQDT